MYRYNNNYFNNYNNMYIYRHTLCLRVDDLVNFLAYNFIHTLQSLGIFNISLTSLIFNNNYFLMSCYVFYTQFSRIWHLKSSTPTVHRHSNSNHSQFGCSLQFDVSIMLLRILNVRRHEALMCLHFGFQQNFPDSPNQTDNHET